ncbi:MAG: 16S rRNA (cytosine(1402)-N(4))-methyltransferase RsmH [Verrucomicrobia subdivision 3 bacterium]|nr:16S rRNA (cytosine(1402)-N(4))-methyltransferase RsmH [Limisphaerales bacterium]
MPEFSHKPVLVKEVIEALRPRDGGLYVDGTVGYGGHSAAILAASAPTGRLIGFDRDATTLEAARRRLAEYVGRFELRHKNFSELADIVERSSCDGVLLDLGISSPQVDEGERGFSFQREGPLDMRMDSRQRVTAAELVNGLDERELAEIFREFGEEPQARRFARAIARERQQARFETTTQLARLIERLSSRHGKKRHPATRVFQALRMAVNDEERSLRSGLAAACACLRPVGRLVVITFQPLEDRIVKEFGREKTRDYTFAGEVDVPELREPAAAEMRWVQRKAVRPSEEELRENPRARSAQLRVLEKL